MAAPWQGYVFSELKCVDLAWQVAVLLYPEPPESEDVAVHQWLQKTYHAFLDEANQTNDDYFITLEGGFGEMDTRRDVVKQQGG